MRKHETFHYETLEQLKADIQQLGVIIPVSEETTALAAATTVGGKMISNRLAVQPMEGCDGTPDGKPAELTVRRYERFARGGAGLLWFEATAVVSEGRANPRQLAINSVTAPELGQMLSRSLAAAQQEFGPSHRPFTVLQLTHSGRYSKPDGTHRPLVAAKNPYLDKAELADDQVVTDAYLDELADKFAEAAELAAEIGFDAVDIKCCHGYLLAELLAAYSRPGKYGGSFANRTRLVLDIVDKIKARTGDKLVLAVRLNTYDTVPYPYGWGVDREDFRRPDLTEAKELSKLLAEKGVQIINVTGGNPYYNPHVNRPYDIGSYIPPVHPLQGVADLLQAAKEIQNAVPQVAVIATGLSWLRQFGANVAAACIQEGWFQLAGFGRQAFAYPDFARHIVTKGGMDKTKVCLACSKCTVIMRDGGQAGCVPRDATVYVPIYKAGREGKPPYETGKISENQ